MQTNLKLKANETEMIAHIGPMMAMQEVLSIAFGGETSGGEGGKVSKGELMKSLGGMAVGL